MAPAPPEAWTVIPALPGNLIRFSVGIERVQDLIADIEQALQSARKTR